MTREEALEKLQNESYTEEQIKEDFEYVSNKLGITTEELWSYFNAPKKTYKDYKSQENIYNFGATLLKIFGIEELTTSLFNKNSGIIPVVLAPNLTPEEERAPIIPFSPPPKTISKLKIYKIK